MLLKFYKHGNKLMKTFDIHIKENSWIAKIAAKKMKADSMAIVIGSTIHLYNTSKENFISNEKWLKHEMCHIHQYRSYGFIGFIFKYLTESIRNGYENNRFEIEARLAENV